MSLKKLGRYDLIRVLGKGAMGVVYEGRDPNLERRVAIKTVKVENLSEEAAAEYESRFRTEARSAARLQHPNIVSVYDSDRDGDIAFLVMEYIQGDDLKHHLDKGIRYSLEQSLKMIRDLLAALDYAHKAGIVHRDIKPANLLIEPGGRVKLTDFGVARIQDSDEATRTQGSMVGTLKYMAPEQVQGLKIDSRADLFSVGVVLYQLLTDKRPFDGDNDFSIIHQIIGHTPPAPSSFNSRLPTAIDAVVARALTKDREQRFATARDFAAALQSAIRRAEDATVVPPADPFKKPEATPSSKGTVPSVVGSGTSATSATSATATVALELELVYWKDIKDSAEPEEFEGFLQQFPAGIYADLARRRLRKLANGSAADQTVLTGPTGTAAREPDLDATRVRAEPSTPMAAPLLATAATAASATVAAPAVPAVAPMAAAAIPATAAPIAQPAAPQSPPQPVVALVRAPVAARTANTDSVEPVSEAVAFANAGPAHADGTTVPPLPSKAPVSSLPLVNPPPETVDPSAAVKEQAPKVAKKPPVAVLAGIGALAVAGLIALTMTGRGSNDEAAVASPASQAASAPAVAAVASAAAGQTPVMHDGVPVSRVAAATPATEAAAVPPVAVVAPPPPKNAPAASSARKPASFPKRAVTVPSVTPTVPTFSNPVPAEAREPREPAVVLRPAPAPVAAAPRPTPPSETCKDRVFLSRQLCLQEECSKPIFQSSRACIAFRAEAKLREDSKVRN